MSEKDYFIDFAHQLGELNGNITAVLARLEKGDAKLAEHEARLSALEHTDGGAAKDTHIPKWAMYAIAALIAALCAALGVKAPIF